MKSQRMCVVCREMKEKDRLFRVVKVGDAVVYDSTFKIQGRGAYVCRKKSCISTAQKKGAFERSLSMRIDPQLYNELETLIDDAE